MARRDQTIEIDGSRYSMVEYSTEKGLELNFRLGQLLGKPLGLLMGTKAADKLGSEEEKKESTAQVFGSALQSFFSSIPAKEFVQLAKDLLEGVHLVTDKESRPVLLNKDFDGLDKVYKLLAEVLKFQFSFLANLVDLTAISAKVQNTAAGRIKAL